MKYVRRTIQVKQYENNILWNIGIGSVARIIFVTVRHASWQDNWVENIRTRSQALVDTTLLLDFPPDTNYHAQQYHLDLRKVETLLITHSHHDHFFPYDICMRTENYATGLSDKKLTVYGNEEVESRFCQAARIDGSVSKFVRFQRLEPFDCVNTEDGYEITAVLADHNQPEKVVTLSDKKGW